MPPRINKRQQREQEELLALGNVADFEADSQEESVPIAPSILGFAAVSATLGQAHMES